MVGGVARRGEGLERSDPIAVRQADLDVAARPGDRRRSEARAERRDARGVVGVVVGQRDAAQAAAPLDLRRDGVEVGVERRPRVDDPGRIAPGDPGVGAGQRERARVGGGDADDVVGGEVDHRRAIVRLTAHRGSMRNTGPPEEAA